MKRYLDIHTHHLKRHDDIFALRSCHADFDAQDDECSIGLHPCFIRDVAAEMDMLRKAVLRPQVKAIGECGLDRLCATPWDMQIQAFSAQIELANEMNKPLIIHCVRAFSETVALLKNAKTPVIFHGFQKNPQLAQDLSTQGFYLSFGAALTDGKINAIDSLAVLPADRFFLETDNADMSIKDIYHQAASVRGIDEDALVAQIHHNYQTVFGI